MADDHANDPIERLGAYRPTTATIDADWSPGDRVRVRAGVVLSSAAHQVRFVPRRRLLLAAPLSVMAVAGLMAGVLLVVLPSGDHGGAAGGGSPFMADAVVPTPRVGTGEYAYRVTEYYRISADGTVEAGGGPAAPGGGVSWDEPVRQRLWTAPDGEQWALSTFGGNTQCLHHRASRSVDFGEPTQEFFDRMPASEAELDGYLRSHVSGSTSQDEAIFVAAGDSLRVGDLLAPSRLRAAWVEVMSHASRMTVHPGERDYLDRPAVRVDFVDQTQRPGELSSLYFDPSTFQLLEERQGTSGAADSYDGPSPAWSSALPGGEPPTSGDELAPPATISVMKDEAVVDRLPDAVQNCQSQ